MLALSRWRPAVHGGQPERRTKAVLAGRRRSPTSGLAGWKLGSAGNVAVEFALALPVLMLLMLGSAEMARFVILHQKIDRVAVTMSDLVARAETISESELDDIFEAAEQVAEPFDLPNLGIVIVSAVTNEDGTGPTVAWQRSGAGSASHASQLGTEGDPATLTADFEVREGETAIIAEVFYDFEPFLSELIVEPQTLYRRAHHRPRLGTLEEIEAG
jgi:Flp pilus assembly protein TadG